MNQPKTKKQLRLMQVMLSSQNGGAETFFDKLVLALADSGVSQLLIIEPNPEREAKLGNHPNITLKSIRFRGWYEITGRFRLIYQMIRWKPSVALCWMNRAIKRTPAFYCPVVARLGGYYRVDRYRKCNLLIGNTPDIVHYLQKEGVEPDKTLCIPNFGEIPSASAVVKDAKAELQRELGIPKEHSILLALGRLHSAKAHDTLIKALAKTSNATLLIAGDGHLLGELEALATELGVAKRVKFLGWRTDAAFLFSAADISVFPSRFEPFGNVVVESWAQKCPIIAANSTGPNWLINDKETGLLFEVDQVDELADRIKLLQSNPETAGALAEAGYKEYRGKFSKKIITECYIQMLKDVSST